ncbi:unnamed protein product [Closterium sp. Naga37s-1]|nr:unnamed protein product [Closterium sp. Naga37s-1]
MESWDPKKVQHLIARSPPHRPFPSYLSSSFPSSLSSSLSSHLALLLSSLSRYARALDAWWGTVAEETFNLSEEFKYVGWPGNYGKAAGGAAGGSAVGATVASAGGGGSVGGAGEGAGMGVGGGAGAGVEAGGAGVGGVNVWRRVKKYRHFVAFMAVVAAVNGLFSLLLIDSLLSGACIPLFHDCHAHPHSHGAAALVTYDLSNINHTRHAASLRSLHQPHATDFHHSAHSSSHRQSLMQQQQDERQSEEGYQGRQGGEEEEGQEDGPDTAMQHDRNKDGNDGNGGSDGSDGSDDENSGSKDGRPGDGTHSSAGLTSSAASAAFFLSRLARSPGVHVTPYPDVPGAYILQTPSTPTPLSSSSSSSSSIDLQDADPTSTTTSGSSSTFPHPPPRCALLLRDVCYVHMQGASRLHRSSAGVWFDREALESALAGDLGGQAIHAASDLSKINLGLVQQCAAGEGGGAGGGNSSTSGTGGSGTGGDGSSSSSSEVADVDSIAEALYEKIGGFLSADEMAFYAASSASQGKQVFRSSALSPPPALPLAVVLPSAGRQSEFADLADVLHDVALHLPTISKPSSRHQRPYHVAGSIKIKGLQVSGSSSVNSASAAAGGTAGAAGADAAAAAAGTTTSAPEDTESSTGPHLFLPSAAHPPNLWVGGATRLLLGPQALALPGRRVGQVKCFQNAVFIPGREQKTRNAWAVEAIRERAWEMVDDVETLVSKRLWGGSHFPYLLPLPILPHSLQRTALLIAMHGPSLANTLFLPPNATLLELFPPHLHSPQHASLAAASRVHYYSWHNAHPLNTTYTSDCMARGQYALLPAALCAGKLECLACVRDRTVTAVHLGELRGVLRKIQQPLRAFFLADSVKHRHRRRGILYGSSSS